MRHARFRRRLLTTAGVLAICVSGLGVPPESARAIEVVGVSEARFAWEPAPGNVTAYFVYVARNGAPLPASPDVVTFKPAANIRGKSGDTVQVVVAAVKDLTEIGPLSQPSYPVRFSATPSPPAIAVSDTWLALTAVSGSEPAGARFSVVNAGGGTLDFEVSGQKPWLQVTPATGSSRFSEVQVRVTVDPSTLVPGLYLAPLAVTSAGVANPAPVNVVLTVLPPIPFFQFSSAQMSATTFVDGAPTEVVLSVSSSVAGATYSLSTDAAWLDAQGSGQVPNGGTEALVLDLDPTGLPSGTYTGTVYLVPTDIRARIIQARVTLQVRDPLPPVDLVNGSFELGPDPGAFVTIGGGSTYIPGWTALGNSIDYIGTVWQASDGGRSIDLEGNGLGGIRQSFATVPGERYVVSFDLAGNAAQAGLKIVRVSVDGAFADFEFDSTPYTLANMGWVARSFEFVAQGEISTLSFEAIYPGSSFGAAIDNVSVDPAP